MALKEVLAIFTLKVEGQKELDAADASVSKLETGVKALGGVLAGAAIGAGAKGLFDWVTGVADATDQTAKFADAIGTSTRDVAEWDQILGNAGVNLQSGRNGLRTFAKQAGNAANGNKDLQKTFRELEVRTKDASGALRPLNDRLTDSVLGLTNIVDPAKRAAAAEKLFGKAGLGFVRVALEGADALQAQRQEFDDLLGGGSYEQFVEDSREAAKSQDRLRNATNALRVGIARALIPVVTKITVGIAKFVKAITKLIKGTKIVQTTLILLGAIAAAVAAKIVIAFAPVILTVLAIVAAFAAIVLIVEDLFVLFTGGESLIGRTIDRILGVGEAEKLVNQVKTAVEELTEFFRRLGEVAIPIISKIADAISTLANKISSAIKRLDALATAAAEELGITSAFRTLAGGAVEAARRGETEISSEDITRAATAGAVRAGRLAPEDVPTQFRPDFEAAQGALARGLTGGFGGAPVTVTNTNTINVTGTGDPEETARVVLEALDEREQDTLRNAREQLGAR